jgi:threonine dehydrogenase-like Zn-dependent dehydrogenase
MPRESCYPIPPEMTFEQAAIAEPLSIGYYAVRLSGLAAGAKIAILGSGPIGLSVMVCAKALGAERIYVTDKIADRVRIARENGAHWSANPGETDVLREIQEREPLLLDAVYECAGQQETVDQGISLLKPGGKLMVIGIPREDRLSFSIDQGRRKEICIQNVRRQNECMQPALDLISAGKVKVDFMVTHHFPFERTKEAFDLVAAYRDGVVKAMVGFP